MLSRPMIEFETDSRLGLGEFGIQTHVVQPVEDEIEPAVGEYEGQDDDSRRRRACRRTAPGTRSGPPEHGLARGRRQADRHRPYGATIGRSRQCDVVLTDPNVSRQHAELRPRGGSWVLSDLGATNGVVLDGCRIDAPEVIKPGDRIELGTALVTFELE